MKKAIVVSVAAALAVTCPSFGEPRGSAAKQAVTSASKLAPPKVSRAVPKGWIENFELAKGLAKAGGKRILLAFSGSDWCGWCVKLEQEVYSQRAFIDQAKRKYVLVMIDNPRNQDSLSTLAREQNRALTQRFAIRGFPSGVVCDADGNELGRIGGYRQGGPEAYLKAMDEQAAQRPAAAPKDAGGLSAEGFFSSGVPVGGKLSQTGESPDGAKAVIDLIERKIVRNKAAIADISAALAKMSEAKDAVKAKKALAGFEAAVKAYFKIYLSGYGQWPLSPEEIAGEKALVAQGTVKALEAAQAQTEATAAKGVYAKKCADMKERLARMKAE